jgi:amino acid adenylation domain-containing protein
LAQEPAALLFANDASFVVASIGAAKAGRIQVPLEVSFPPARIAYMLEQSQARVIVTDRAHGALARSLGTLPVIEIDALDPATPATNPGLRLSPDAPAAIGYTSGSTGQPKGIVWSHRGMLHAVMRHTNAYRIGRADRIVMFRATVRPPLYALLNGAAYFPVHLRDAEPVRLAEWIARERITVYRAAVSVFRGFAGTLTGKEAFPDLRLVALFGEPVLAADVALLRKHFASGAVLASSLGCNEFDDYACCFVDRNSPLPTGTLPGGYPIGDTEVLIVDERGTTLRDGEIGEIVIRSPYNAIGYWLRPDLTAAAFANDPDGSDKRLYHTGDLGRRAPDGCLYHHGRKDFQVKIRGYRVEVSEVEAALAAIDGVREAAVVGRERGTGDRILVGYIVWNCGDPPLASALRRQLAERLPDYMVPTVLVFLDALPRTPTGKVDRRVLPAPDGARPLLDTRYVAPRNAAEQALAAIWADVLGLECVGVDDAFVDLGGDSLAAMRVASRVTAQAGVAIPLGVLLECATIAEMAARLAELLANRPQPAPPPLRRGSR